MHVSLIGHAIHMMAETGTMITGLALKGFVRALAGL